MDQLYSVLVAFGFKYVCMYSALSLWAKYYIIAVGVTQLERFLKTSENKHKLNIAQQDLREKFA
jgi:hypothetical protein